MSVYASKIDLKDDQLRLTLVTFDFYDAYPGNDPAQFTAVLSFRFAKTIWTMPPRKM